MPGHFYNGRNLKPKTRAFRIEIIGTRDALNNENTNGGEKKRIILSKNYKLFTDGFLKGCVLNKNCFLNLRVLFRFNM